MGRADRGVASLQTDALDGGKAPVPATTMETSAFNEDERMAQQIAGLRRRA